jgi:hypothetical protein
MGPDKDSPTPAKNQDVRRTAGTRRSQRRALRPRSRACLLKGCGRVFRPEQPMARYCSDECREKARRWRQWKARQRYRQSPNGKQRRRAQGRRYRARRKEQRARETAAVTAARVIPTNFFFLLLRPPRMLCGVRSDAAVTPAAFLFANLSRGSGACSGAGAPLARTTTGAGEKRPRNLASPLTMNACRYRPDILHSPRQSR